ncbi:hypothetical protein BhaS171_00032 [Bacillus phage vB_BhaS-171]|uniref:hypothetical protein n=1 Tax=Bacillus phage vB_BhaS-171 TaxID=1775140 RepID=UPI000744D138|nr:hypothetical protein BH781_gp32 [Bacillus phage vB_BhaS-171]ALY08088.1 hypothetical protein BhaS171_00032 [Bacillus phage vB_BhaS-171]
MIFAPKVVTVGSVKSFMSGGGVLASISPPALPITEGYILFGGLGVVLLLLIYAEKKGWIDEASVSASLLIAFWCSVVWFIFKAPLAFLVGM